MQVDLGWLVDNLAMTEGPFIDASFNMAQRVPWVILTLALAPGECKLLLPQQ